MPAERAPHVQHRSGVWVLAAAVAVTAALALVGRHTDRTPAWRLAEQQQDEQCLEMFPASRQSLTERMLLRKDGGWLRVHISTSDHWLAICQGGPDSLTSTYGTVFEPAAPGELTFYGGYDSVLKAGLLIGHIPSAATQISAQLSDGRIVTGDHDGDVFVIRLPGTDVIGATVSATDADGRLVATAPAPAE